MSERSDLIERLRVASPCPANWAGMEGDERTRFCRLCSLHVYNLSEMTSREAEALIRRTEGRLCARLYRRADGTVITKDCPVGLRALRRRVARRAGAALAAVLALCGGAFGQKAGPDDKPQACAGGTTYKLKREAAGGKGSAFKGRVVDPNGAVIAGADILLRARGKKTLYGGATSDEGTFEVRALPPGEYKVEIHSPGFQRFRLSKLSVGADEVVRIELSLNVAGETVEVVVGGVALDPLTDTGPGLRTVFTQEQIKRLPY
ncbi:MAG TPA: carboxypeptidase-like regulatory domain-containing protein [Pyrinomonadaceae bacterium]|nr:carboxypeptidase-like regulatory domain-containing protein [Pyrinomonadaceae bacterium]